MKTITVFGIGGIGGLLAGPLIRTYGDKVSLIARGARKDHLLNSGLTMHSDILGEFTVRPSTVTEDLSALPKQDIILLCMKNGDLPDVIPQLRAAVEAQTAVIPLLNGISAGEILRKELPCGHVCDSVIYTVSSSEPDFSIRQIGPLLRLFIGAGEGDPEAAEAAESSGELLQKAGINCAYRPDTRKEVWKKFILNCAYNVVTAARGVPTGRIANDPQWMREYRQLMEEAREVAIAEGIPVEEEVIDRFVGLVPTYAPDSESSLSRDFAKCREGEWDIFSGEVIHKAAQHGIDVPVTRMYEEMMRERIRSWKQPDGKV